MLLAVFYTPSGRIKSQPPTANFSIFYIFFKRIRAYSGTQAVQALGATANLTIGVSEARRQVERGKSKARLVYCLIILLMKREEGQWGYVGCSRSFFIMNHIKEREQ